jgi:hypothetical protein
LDRRNAINNARLFEMLVKKGTAEDHLLAMEGSTARGDEALWGRLECHRTIELSGNVESATGHVNRHCCYITKRKRGEIRCNRDGLLALRIGGQGQTEEHLVR